jgi:hypothetical protein
MVRMRNARAIGRLIDSPPGDGADTCHARYQFGGTMKFILITAAMLVAAITTATTSAQAQSRQDFTLINRTGYDISEVYISPGHANDWEEDILGKDLLENGERREIAFHRVGKTCIWDLKVVYHDDDSSAVWHDIDLCSVAKITIRYNRKTDTTSATFD